MKRWKISGYTKLSILLFIVFIILSSYLVITQWEELSEYPINQLVIIGVSYLLLQFCLLVLTKKISIERKILVGLWVFTFFLNIIAIRLLPLVEKLSLQDVFYTAVLLFMGEFYITQQFEMTTLLNIGRFLAIFVVSGSVLMFTLSKKIRSLKIRLFYRDVLIISERPEDYVIDLAQGLLDQNTNKVDSDSKNTKRNKRKVIIGYTDNSEIIKFDQEVDIPVIPINIDDAKGLKSGLKACNVKNAKKIYLLCNETELNMKIAKVIYDLYYRNGSKKIINSSESKNKIEKNSKKIIGNKVHEFFGSKKNVICYIKYKTIGERNFYSFDSAFNNINCRFNTCFINLYDISIRQMITCSSIGSSFKPSDFTEAKDTKITPEGFKKGLNNIKILVAGSGELLRSTLSELSRIAVYNNKLPYEVYYFDHKTELKKNKAKKVFHFGLSEERFRVIPIKPDVIKKLKHIKQFYISSNSETEIREIIQKSFQYDVGRICEEIFITTEGSNSEYEILLTYIEAIFKKEILGAVIPHNVYVSRVSDLLLRYDAFYKEYGPKANEVIDNYLNSIMRNNNKFEIVRFDKLPQIFKDSTIMSILHIDYICDVIKSLKKMQFDNNLSHNKLFERLDEYITHLSQTEHKRWFNERSIQGYILSETKDDLINKNPSMMQWDKLNLTQKKKHNQYLIPEVKNRLSQNRRIEIKDELIKKFKIQEDLGGTNDL